MTGRDDAGADPQGPTDDGVPTVACSRCDREWRLDYELAELAVGNQAVEQFALDHHRHTGHFPDDVSTWRVRCRRCPETAAHLAERAARRWAESHARHTRHSVELLHADLADPERVEPPIED